MQAGYDTRVLGFNYRLPEMAAALASVQMDKLNGYIEARRRNSSVLTETISPMKGVALRQTSSDRRHVWYLYTVFLAKKRDEVMKKLRARGVGAAAYWETPVNRMPLYKRLGYAEKSLPSAVSAAGHVLSLPVHPGVTEAEIEFVAEEFVKAVKS
jgi:dTDP-4-amino-4,6-dideoxygalactose transaminase